MTDYTTSSVSMSSPTYQNLQLNYWGLSLVFVTPMLGGFLYGFDIGATSFVLSMLLDTDKDTDDDNGKNETVWWTSISSIEIGLFVSALSLGALIGSHIILMYLSNIISRRTELRICSILYFVGILCNVSSGTIFSSSSSIIDGFYILFLGRLIFGIGVGFIMHGAPAYMAEMCPPQIRGAVLSAKETVIVGGIVLGYTVGNWFSSLQRHSSSNTTTSWTDLYAITISVIIPMIVLTFCYIPRSTRWLILNNKKEEAYESMKFIYKEVNNDVNATANHTNYTNYTNGTATNHTYCTNGPILEDIFEEMVSFIESDVAAVSEQRQERQHQQLQEDEHGHEQNNGNVETYEGDHDGGGGGICSVVCHPRYRPSMIASTGLIIFQQVSGQPSILSYTTLLFDAAGYSGNASVITSIIMMCTSIVTVLFVDRIGRTFMLRLCCIVMMTSLLVLSISFWNWQEEEEDDDVVEVLKEGDDGSTRTTTTIGIIFTKQYKYIILFAMFIYIGSYQIGFGPITWCIVSEIFPLQIRTKSIALCVELNYLLNFIISFIFPIIQQSIGWGKTFLCFAILLFVAYFFIQQYVPETTNMTLEEIQQVLLDRYRHHNTTTTADDDNNINNIEGGYTDSNGFATTITNTTTTTTSYDALLEESDDDDDDTKNNVVATEQSDLLTKIK